MSDEQAAKSKPFFDRAAQVAETGNWDYAIEMYLQGINREPQAVERGHEKLREVALRRKASGGKSAGFLDKMKRKGGKTPDLALHNAEWLMSRDPGDMSYWRLIVQAAKAGQWPDVARWAGKCLYELNRALPKPSKEVYGFLAQTYTDMKLWPEAVTACQAALNLDPSNGELQNMMRNVSAQATIEKGRYDQEGSFTKSVKDMDKQIELLKQDQLSADEGFLEGQIRKARAAYEAEPTVAGKITGLVDALTRIEDEGYENEAIDVLTKAHADTGVYRFKMRIGDIRERQLKRRYSKLAKGEDKAAAQQAAKELLAFQLTEYAERAANYPTDLGLKYELGRLHLAAGQYDEAIAVLQQARRDPKRRIAAMSYLAQAFYKKGWFGEAAEFYEQALNSELNENQTKELKYSLGVVYEAQGKNDQALEQFSEVAQIDFNFRDVRDRIERLRPSQQG